MAEAVEKLRPNAINPDLAKMILDILFMA